MSESLTEFLLARIAEDEASARKFHPEEALVVHFEADLEPTALYTAARALAECEAKRRIVEAFVEERVRRDIYNRGYDDGLLTTDDDLRNRLASNAYCRGLEDAMRAHATVYADHPDYREEWAH